MTIQLKRAEREKKRQELEIEFAAVFQEVDKKKKALAKLGNYVHRGNCSLLLIYCITILELALTDMESTRERKDREFRRLQKNLMQLLLEQKKELDELREKGSNTQLFFVISIIQFPVAIRNWIGNCNGNYCGSSNRNGSKGKGTWEGSILLPTIVITFVILCLYFISDRRQCSRRRKNWWNSSSCLCHFLTSALWICWSRYEIWMPVRWPTVHNFNRTNCLRYIRYP